MKNIVLIIITLLICIGGVSSTYLLLDRSSPDIIIISTPSMGCDVSFDDLLSFAQASDDKGIKSFFIEEDSLNSIAENGYLTYVAVDTSNHVKKKQSTVNVERSLKEYRIEILKPLSFQVKEIPNIEEYLRITNGCNWDIDEQVEIDGVDLNKMGTYEAEIYSRKHSNIEPLIKEVTVSDLRIPVIMLNSESAEGSSERYYSDDYFLSFIDHIEDDVDDAETLREGVLCDWMEALGASQSGYVSRSGNFAITYSITDSDGNIGTAVLNMRLNAPVITEPETEGE